jgi:hypothetical protein
MRFQWQLDERELRTGMHSQNLIGLLLQREPLAEGSYAQQWVGSAVQVVAKHNQASTRAQKGD